MNKKGFTLVELLGTLIILSVIFLISIPVIMSFIEDIRTSVYREKEKDLEQTAKIFVALNDNYIPKQVGNTIYVTMNLLVTNEVMNPIIDTKTNTVCDGYVILRRTTATKVVYEPFIDCSESYKTNGYIDLVGLDPTIDIIGSTYIEHQIHTPYIDQGANAHDPINSDITDMIIVHDNVDEDIAGTYTVVYEVDNGTLNPITATRTVVVKDMDAVAPTITFGTNGALSYAKTRSTTVTVSDASSGVDASTLKYLWNQSIATPDEVNFLTSFTNGATITTPAAQTGGYYLWIFAKDNNGNVATIKSNIFNLDNTPPTITVVGGTSVNYITGTSVAYADLGATANDVISGNLTTSIVPSIPTIDLMGTYIVNYSVADTAGNTASASRTVVVNQINVAYLIVAGGGSGGKGWTTGWPAGGGGGGGGKLSGTTNSSSTSYAVVIGAGGAGQTVTGNGNNGGNSSMFGLTAIGGGGGGGSTAGSPGNSGGNGGGGGSYGTAGGAGGAGTSGQGYAGGTGMSSGDVTHSAGGGGGGAGATGQSSPAIGVGGNGGAGYLWINGVTYGGGGGGNGGSGGAGGAGGGTSGGGTNSSASAAANTGGGSGGARTGTSGSGGSGIVIVRYYGAQKATGGTITSSGGYTTHTFTSGGTFTVN